MLSRYTPANLRNLQGETFGVDLLPRVWDACGTYGRTRIISNNTSANNLVTGSPDRRAFRKDEEAPSLQRTSDEQVSFSSSVDKRGYSHDGTSHQRRATGTLQGIKGRNKKTGRRQDQTQGPIKPPPCSPLVVGEHTGTGSLRQAISAVLRLLAEHYEGEHRSPQGARCPVRI